MCVCVCVCARESERRIVAHEREREIDRATPYMKECCNIQCCISTIHSEVLFLWLSFVLGFPH